MIGFTPRVKVCTVFGIDVYSDPTLPVGSWLIEGQEARDLAKRVSELEKFLQCHLMRIKSIDIVDYRDKQT